MTLQQLKNQHPELIQQIRAEATKEAVLAERERILGIAEVIAPEATKKVRAMIEAGLNAKQAKAMLGTFAGLAEEDKKNQILAALKAAHGEGVAGNVGGMSRGENSLMSVIRARNKDTDSRRNPLVATKEKLVE